MATNDSFFVQDLINHLLDRRYFAIKMNKKNYGNIKASFDISCFLLKTSSYYSNELKNAITKALYEERRKYNIQSEEYSVYSKYIKVCSESIQDAQLHLDSLWEYIQKSSAFFIQLKYLAKDNNIEAFEKLIRDSEYIEFRSAHFLEEELFYKPSVYTNVIKEHYPDVSEYFSK